MPVTGSRADDDNNLNPYRNEMAEPFASTASTRTVCEPGVKEAGIGAFRTMVPLRRPE